MSTAPLIDTAGKRPELRALAKLGLSPSLMRGLRRAVVPGYSHDLVGRSKITSSVGTVITSSGPAYSNNVADNTRITVPSWASTGQSSVFLIQQRSTTDNNGWLELGIGGGGSKGDFFPFSGNVYSDVFWSARWMTGVAIPAGKSVTAKHTLGLSVSSGRQLAVWDGAIWRDLAVAGSYTLPAQLTLMGAPAGEGSSFGGKLWLALFWDRALSATELRELNATVARRFYALDNTSFFDAGAGGGDTTLTGAAAIASTASAALTAELSMSAAAASVITASGVVNQSLGLSGSSAAITAANGEATITTNLSGDAFNQVFAAGLLNQALAMQADATAAATGLANLDGGSGLEGSASAAATGGGSINLTATLSGASLIQAFAAADLDSGSQSDLSGNASAGASGGGIMQLAMAMLGNAGILATGSGAVATTIPVSGLAPATVTGSGGLSNTQALSGAGVAVANGSGDITVGVSGLSASALVEALAGGSIQMSVSMSADALIRAVASAVLSAGAEVIFPDGFFRAANMSPRYRARSLSRAN